MILLSDRKTRACTPPMLYYRRGVGPAMSQEQKPWVLISVIKDGTTMEDMEAVVPRVKELVDEWHSRGRIMWSGSFDDEATGMAVFEGTKQEADEFFKKYDDTCSGKLEYTMYGWDAMPVLSLLSKGAAPQS